MFPLAAAALLYGWAGMASVGIVLSGALVAVEIWRRIHWRGCQLQRSSCLWMALLLALALPPHLANAVQWPLLAGAGFMLVILMWVLAAFGGGRVHPVAATYLILLILFEPMLTPHWVLRPDRLFVGNLFHAGKVGVESAEASPWIYQRRGPTDDEDANSISQPASAALTQYTSGRQQPERFSLSLQMLLRDQLPPLENMVIGGEPGPTGAASAAAVLLGGLFLLYRGLIDWRIPLFSVLAALVTLLICPVPVIISETAVTWRWLAIFSTDPGWAQALTLANYELFASPLLFVAFFVATSPQCRPMNARGRIAFGILFGVLTALGQLYISVSAAAYGALLIAGLASPALDRIFCRKTWDV